jgi:hypothetical protein
MVASIAIGDAFIIVSAASAVAGSAMRPVQTARSARVFFMDKTFRAGVRMT